MEIQDPAAAKYHGIWHTVDCIRDELEKVKLFLHPDNPMPAAALVRVEKILKKLESRNYG